MQNTPTKNRGALTIGAIVLVVAVGAVAIWAGTRGKGQEMPEPGISMLEEAGMTSATPSTPEDKPKSSAPTESGKEQETAAPQASSEVPEFHVVSADETLSSISRKYYNSHIYAGDIEALNQLENPNHLLVGQKLTLPRPQELAKIDGESDAAVGVESAAEAEAEAAAGAESAAEQESGAPAATGTDQ